MTTLLPTNFSEYFTELWGDRPFPWQERLALQVCQGDGWPANLDLPTATGKTAALDIAVFHLALEATKGPDRRAPLRVVFVVDRRIVVDSAWVRARTIAEKLARAEGGMLRTVADRLRSLAGEGEQPLTVARLRGGMPRDRDWTRSVCQPTIVCSTVDQAGSRLLFRGYGVSDSMKPVHAGLLGADALWLIDEAHLAKPFLQTLESIKEYRRPPWVHRQPLSPFHFVAMSATQGRTEAVFTLNSADWEHKFLGKRLHAHKPAHLMLIDAAQGDGRAAEAFAEQALTLSALRNPSAGATVVGVVVNRVRLARAIHHRLEEAVRAPTDDSAAAADVELIIGPSRPLDREAQLEELLPRMRAQQRIPGKPLFVVATQTIEVGADVDFDALVTQVAPLDALRQRFGRLNRLGNRTAAPTAILATSEEVGSKVNDPVYGTASRDTWNWLQSVASAVGQDQPKRGRSGAGLLAVDFGVQPMQALLSDVDVAALQMSRADAPILMPAYIDLWAQTSPLPALDPDPALFLHGPDSGQPDVTIVWRADVPDPTKGSEEDASEIVSAIPPSTLEAVRVSIAEARRWLYRTAQGDLADVTGTAHGDSPERRPEQQSRIVWRWDGEHCKGASAENLRPGDVLIAPAEYGGCDNFGWNPASEESPVHDLAERASLQQRHLLRLRVQRDILANELSADGSTVDPDAVWQRVAAALGTFGEGSPRDLVAGLQEVEGLPLRWRMALQLLRPEDRRARIQVATPYGEDAASGCILLRDRVLSEQEVKGLISATPTGDEGTQDSSTDIAAADYVGREIGLSQHCADVEREAREAASRAGLPVDFIEAVTIAGKLHDRGKAERRFQALLRGGDFWAIADMALAKSKTWLSPMAQDRIRTRIGLPPRSRHECWSVRLAERYLAERSCQNPDLVLYLIGVHHGWGRPFFPPVEDPDAQGEVRTAIDGQTLSTSVEHHLTALTAGWPDLSLRLLREYGAWELARLEAIVRLADHRASAHPTDLIEEMQ
jgi:CRISPR-associated endonuclease/helicase Cas3